MDGKGEDEEREQELHCWFFRCGMSVGLAATSDWFGHAVWMIGRAVSNKYAMLALSFVSHNHRRW